MGAAVEAWIGATLERHAPLSFVDLRRGVRSLSLRYVERRREAGAGLRAFSSPARRAAFASYYAALHFLTAYHACSALRPGGLAARRVVDAGCGTGAVGAAVALGLEPTPRLLAIDRASFALREARCTFRAFGLRAEVRRGTLPRQLPRAGPGDLLVFGWTVNELERDARERLLARVGRALERGAGLIVLEPLAGFVSPWWEDWHEALRPRGVDAHEWKSPVHLPEWLERMDRAAGLDHAELGARILVGAPR